MRAAGMTWTNGQWGTGDCRVMESAYHAPADIKVARILSGISLPGALTMEGHTICHGKGDRADRLMTEGPRGRR